MAGIQVTPEVVDKFNHLKFGKDMKYFTCKLSDDLTQVVMDTVGGANATWEDMEAALPRNDCRYAFFHFDYEEEGAKRLKLVFVRWCPDTSAIKQKMLYSTTTQSLTKLCDGIGCKIQATDASEVCRAEVLAQVTRI